MIKFHIILLLALFTSTGVWSQAYLDGKPKNAKVVGRVVNENNGSLENAAVIITVDGIRRIAVTDFYGYFSANFPVDVIRSNPFYSATVVKSGYAIQTESKLEAGANIILKKQPNIAYIELVNALTSLPAETSLPKSSNPDIEFKKTTIPGIIQVKLPLPVPISKTLNLEIDGKMQFETVSLDIPVKVLMARVYKVKLKPKTTSFSEIKEKLRQAFELLNQNPADQAQGEIFIDLFEIGEKLVRTNKERDEWNILKQKYLPMYLFLKEWVVSGKANHLMDSRNDLVEKYNKLQDEALEINGLQKRMTMIDTLFSVGILTINKDIEWYKLSGDPNLLKNDAQFLKEELKEEKLMIDDYLKFKKIKPDYHQLRDQQINKKAIQLEKALDSAQK